MFSAFTNLPPLERWLFFSIGQEYVRQDRKLTSDLYVPADSGFQDRKLTSDLYVARSLLVLSGATIYFPHRVWTRWEAPRQEDFTVRLGLEQTNNLVFEFLCLKVDLFMLIPDLYTNFLLIDRDQQFLFGRYCLH